MCISRYLLVINVHHLFSSIWAIHCKSVTRMFRPFWVGFPYNHYLLGWPTGGLVAMNCPDSILCLVVSFVEYLNLIIASPTENTQHSANRDILGCPRSQDNIGKLSFIGISESKLTNVYCQPDVWNDPNVLSCLELYLYKYIYISIPVPCNI